MEKIALTIALILGLFLAGNNAFGGKKDNLKEDNFVWRGRKLLQRGEKRGERNSSGRDGPIFGCPCSRGPITRCPTCVCPTTSTTTQRPTCSERYNEIMVLPQCNQEVLVKLLNQLRSTTTTNTASPGTTKSSEVESTTRMKQQTNGIHRVKSTIRSSEKANQTTTSNTQTISVSTQSFDNMTRSGSKAAPIQITSNNTQLNVTKPNVVTTGMTLVNISLTTQADAGRSNITTLTVRGETALPTVSISTASTPENVTRTPTATAINETTEHRNNTRPYNTTEGIVGTPTTLKAESTSQTSPERCVDNGIDIDEDPDKLLLRGCNLVCRGLGFCFLPSEVNDMLPEICATWLHIYCENSSALYINCLLKYLPISGFICPGKESKEVQRIGICRNCTDLCLANTFSQDLTRKDSCDKVCREKHSCVKLTTSQKKKNLSKLSKGCRKCLKNECGDGGNARFKRGCDYYAIIGECQEDCSDIYACDFCFTC